MERYIELSDKTPFSDEEAGHYQPSQEPIQNSNYKADLEPARLNRSLRITQTDKIRTTSNTNYDLSAIS